VLLCSGVERLNLPSVPNRCWWVLLDLFQVGEMMGVCVSGSFLVCFCRCFDGLFSPFGFLQFPLSG
jgi:hypothetical protein